MKHVIYVVGIGPGSIEHMTFQAKNILEACDCIIGYNTYIELIRPYFPEKEYIMTGMTKEVDRCRLAIEKAGTGRSAAMISSGDAGVYGMAGIMYEVAADYPDVEIKVVAGITAACSGAALLGAPLVSDFCLISLSDLLTPWETIAKRLEAAAAADFVVCLYNPASKRRAGHLQRACQIMLRHQEPNIPVGVVHCVGREGEKTEITTLGKLSSMTVDMFSTIIIGNSQTKIIAGYMVTPRGYQLS